jgi:hypothetical protein
MEFIDIAYSYLTPLLLLGILVLKKSTRKYIFNTIAFVNIALIFYSIFIARQLYALYYISKSLPFSNNRYHFNIGWLQLRLGLLMLLPVVFLFRKLSANLLITCSILVLLWWDKIQFLYKSGDTSVYGFYSGIDLLFKILNYTCLLIAGYALLWLFNRLPYQQAQN